MCLRATAASGWGSNDSRNDVPPSHGGAGWWVGQTPRPSTNTSERFQWGGIVSGLHLRSAHQESISFPYVSYADAHYCTLPVTALDFVPATSPPSFSCSSRFTFDVAGEFYMIPAHDNEADIRLFRCVKWPSKWKFEATLLQPSNQVADVSLVQWQVHVTSRPAWGNDLTVVVA